MKVLGVIPARYNSTRLPGKALININNKPMIQWVWEKSAQTKLIDRLIVATDDRRIFNIVISFGGEALMTSKHHRSGTDRIAEVVKKINCDIIANIQVDEPFIEANDIDKAIRELLLRRAIDVSTLCCKIKNKEDLLNPNIVKVVFDKNQIALYFSRNPIPYNVSEDKVTYYKHIGLYVYRKKYLMKHLKLKPSTLEKSEKLEQLRILENGYKIGLVISDGDTISVDTPEDLEKACKFMIKKIKNYN